MPAEPRERSGDRLRDEVNAPTSVPMTDVFETDTNFVIIADMPGVAPDRLEVTAEGESLTIRGRVVRAPHPPQHREFTLNQYAQTFVLTEDLDSTRIQATLKDGVLRITIPKSATVQPRRIEIRTD